MATLAEGSGLDIIVHLTTAAIALILLGLSFLAYRRTPRQRLMYVLAAFLIFALKELLVAIDVLYFNDPLLVFVSHALNLAILGLFFFGVISE